jgi:hypothetical protein
MAEPTEQIQTSIPSWLKDPILQLVAQAQALAGQGYQPYAKPKFDAQGNPVYRKDAKGDPILDAEGNPIQELEGLQRTAGFNKAQEDAFKAIAAMQTAGQLDQATGLAGLAGLDAQKLGKYTAFSDQFRPKLDPQTGQPVLDSKGQPVLEARPDFYKSPTFERMALDPYEKAQAAAATQYQMAGIPGVMARGFEAGRMGPVRDVIAQQYTAPQMTGYERVGAPSAYDIERAQAYQYGPLAMSPSERVRAQNLREYRMGPAERVQAERFGLGAMQEYMSPFMQSVVERQKQAATQDYLRGLPALGAAAARAGGRGGTREALLQAEARRNLATQLGDIEAGGLQKAYEQATGQFERDRAAAMQAALANQAATQDVARQNLQAAMGIQQLGSGQSLEAQRLNQAMGLTVGQQNLAAEQARQQFMGQQDLQAQLANQQAAQRQAEFQRQQQMQAAMANQQAGLTVGQQNLAAQLQAMGLNAQQAIEAARLNQAADLTTGQQNLSAYQQAQIANQQADLQGQLANQQMGYNVGQQNLQALINQSQFGASQGLQAQQLNQAAQLQRQQQALAQLAQANQFSQENERQRAQYGLAGANLAEQSRQFGAGMGMQGLQQQLAAAGMLGNLGMQQYQQQMGINAAQLGAGGQQQALEQELLNTQYQDFLNQQRLPYQQLEFLSGILRGLPATGQTQTMYQAPGSMFGQIAGIGLGVGSLFGGLGSTTGGGGLFGGKP